MAFEQPKYEVLEKYEEFELREYAPYLVAETVVEGEFEETPDRAFSVLFNYISGANTGQEKIKMTVPVSQENAPQKGEKIKMTVPVTQDMSLQKQGKYNLAFVVPSKYSLQTVPQPTDPRVTIRQIPAKTMAVIRYSGSWKEKNYRKYEEKLLQALKQEGLTPLADPVFARYNPPFWPNFLNRNEILIEVK